MKKHEIKNRIKLKINFDSISSKIWRTRKLHKVPGEGDTNFETTQKCLPQNQKFEVKR